MIDQLENILKAKLEEALKPIEKRLHDLEEKLSLEIKKYQTCYQNLNAEFKDKYSSFCILEKDFKELQSQIKETQTLATQVLLKTEESLKDKSKIEIVEKQLKEVDYNSTFQEILSQIQNQSHTKPDYYNQDTTQDQQEIVYKTTHGQKYHRQGCGYLSRSCFPLSLQQAEKQGLTECSRCGY